MCCLPEVSVWSKRTPHQRFGWLPKPGTSQKNTQHVSQLQSNVFFLFIFFIHHIQKNGFLFQGANMRIVKDQITPHLCLQRRWHLWHRNDYFSCCTYILLSWSPLLYRCFCRSFIFHLLWQKCLPFQSARVWEDFFFFFFLNRCGDAFLWSCCDCLFATAFSVHCLDFFRKERHLPSASQWRVFFIFLFFPLLLSLLLLADSAIQQKERGTGGETGRKNEEEGGKTENKKKEQK